MTTIPDPSLIATDSDGTEAVRVLKGGRWRWMMTGLLRGLKGDKGDSVKGDKGDPGTPKRIELYASSVSGKVVFKPAFAAAPVVTPNPLVVGGQLVLAIPSNVTANGCDVTILRSRGTLVLTSGPFETVTGVAGSVLALGS